MTLPCERHSDKACWNIQSPVSCARAAFAPDSGAGTCSTVTIADLRRRRPLSVCCPDSSGRRWQAGPWTSHAGRRIVNHPAAAQFGERG